MRLTLAIDVYGTMINTSGLQVDIENKIGGSAVKFLNTWRSKQLEYSFRMGLAGEYNGFSKCTEYALQYACSFFGVSLTKDDKMLLLEKYKQLPAFEDVPQTLEQLMNAGINCYAFSNGESAVLNELLAHANLIDKFTGVISVEEKKTFKPDPAVYKHFNELTNTHRENTYLVSGNPFDILGAINYGFKTIWVNRNQAIFDPWEKEPDFVVKSFLEINSLF